MSLGEYLSVPFLISLGITLLLVGIIGMFFTQRLQEQNHKINSMVGLISTMAEEIGYLRNKSNQNGCSSTPLINTAFGEQNNLIEVSDGDDSSESDGDESSESDSDDSYDSDDEENDENDEIENLNQSNIKVINIQETLYSNNQFEEILEEIEDLNDMKNEDNNDDDDDDDDDESDSSESVNLVELDSNNDLNALDISLSNSDNKNLNLSVLDYKKLSLGKLRNIVMEKGLSKDANKLKKHELLNLLGF
jgi:hypothetical protein